MHTPNAMHWDPSPDYIRALTQRIMQAEDLNQKQIAKRLGISERMYKRYVAQLDTSTYSKAPYPVQFALETWAEELDRQEHSTKGK